MSANENNEIFSGSNGDYLAGLYSKYLQDPFSVDDEWGKVFANLDQGAKDLLQGLVNGDVPSSAQVPKMGSSALASLPSDKDQTLRDAIRVAMMIRSYRVRGHLLSDLDPLGLDKRDEQIELDPKFYGFSDADLDRSIYLGGTLNRDTATLREIVDILKHAYSSTIGVEFMHLIDYEQKEWIQNLFENPTNREQLTVEDKKAVFYELIRAHQFERFLHTKFPGAKRFGLEGGESTIPALEQIIFRAAGHGVEDVILGMAHRGRLNVLANVMGKPVSTIVSEFEGKAVGEKDVQGSGDVKYHLGSSQNRTIDGKDVHLSLTANPSHLEAVNPVVIGKVRAKQKMMDDKERRKVMGLLIHGDAAMAGQGLVAETLMISELQGYRVGGTMHVVINNQIGFTTSPKHSRSSPYCSDVAKSIQAPIFHVNGNDPEAVAFVARAAMDFRQKFQKDVVIDLFCYRQHGHNEMDEPSFTQPLMYKTIGKQTPVKDLYKEKLISEGILSEDEAQALENKYESHLKDEFEAAKSYKPKKADWLDGVWSGFDVGSEKNRDGDTEVPMKTLKQIADTLTSYPEGFKIHKRLERILKDKAERLESGENIDWATAEALAFGSLVCEGKPVRLSGQDSCRGTFSQRHSVFIHQETEEKYTPLNHIKDGQAQFKVLDSPLSEAAVLGFEYGYSLADPQALVLWEAQFGDFVNGAQVLIDQFISSGEAKWLRMSGLVMLLPHGYEGQGPEHSSARLERFLQQCAGFNWQVANCTTPANYFHLLRRQLNRKIRKPLVIMTPKALLRHKLAVSTLKDMGPGTQFHRVLGESDSKIAKNKSVKRVIFCTGKVYYDLLAERDERKIKDIAFVRLEQLYPFPEDEIAQQLKSFKNAESIVWCQEEPENMGSWTFVVRKLEKVLINAKMKATRPEYVGRAESAATATGHAKTHEKEQKDLVDRALTLD